MGTTADKNKAENEVVFRNFNERMNKGIHSLKKIATEEGQFTDVPDLKKSLYYCCECADENCRDRIKISSSTYAKLHGKNNSFVIIPGHNVKEIERVVLRRPNYEVVEKYIEPSKSVKGLHITDFDVKKLRS
ncbi:MAG: hypothetical protein JWO47_567 [Candidatus Saccharibacteria bacterium]|nr:hypothetical protein [Candidatus Saccharibacteria bacterium]